MRDKMALRAKENRADGMPVGNSNRAPRSNRGCQTKGSETSMKLERRTVLKGIVGGVSALALKAPAIAQSAPFKIGLLTVKTGPLAQGGIQMEQGIATLLKERSNTFAGRKIEFISADTGGNPAGTKTKAQELIE